jgi:hypothetical protein
MPLGLGFEQEEYPIHFRSFYRMAQEYFEIHQGKHSTKPRYANVPNNYWISIFGEKP